MRDDDRPAYSIRDGAEEAVGALTIPIVRERVVAEGSLQKDQAWTGAFVALAAAVTARAPNE